MPHQAAPASRLPSLMMPCPVCTGRMAYQRRHLIEPDVEDTVYACRRCGAELIRTSVRAAQPKNDGKRAAAAA
jgi:predicted SprT family Zn-dependent metalloprotease